MVWARQKNGERDITSEDGENRGGWKMTVRTAKRKKERGSRSQTGKKVQMAAGQGEVVGRSDKMERSC